MQDKILLTRGRFTVVDKEDFAYLNGFKWCCSINGYACRRSGSRMVLMHREIMQPKKRQIIDHINGDKLDNRKRNLRVCNYQTNILNRHNLAKNNHSGFTGVAWNRLNKNWRANITLDKKFIDLGSYKNFDDAVIARKEALFHIAEQI